MPAYYCMKSTCDVAVWPCATVAQLKLESLERQLYTLMAVQHTGLASYCPERAISPQNTEVYTLHQLIYKVRHCSVSGLPHTEVLQQNKHFSATSVRHVIVRRQFSFVPFVLGVDSRALNAALLPAPQPSRLSLSMEETPGPRGRGAHVQLLLFLRPSVLVMECSPNISLTSAETLPRAFAAVSTKCRISAAPTHGVYRTREAMCCHRGRRAISRIHVSPM